MSEWKKPSMRNLSDQLRKVSEAVGPAIDELKQAQEKALKAMAETIEKAGGPSWLSGSPIT